MSPEPRHLVLLGVILLAAAWLRVHDLGSRPMHADEANQAVKLGQMLAGGGYRFDPADHHGPTLYYFALLPAWVRGERSLAELTEVTVRLTPALFGVAAVALVWLLARPLGPWPALAAALLLAVAPAAVYYSRYFIQETLLVTFTLAALACGGHAWRTGSAAGAVGTGIMTGLMFATKASAPVYAAAAAAALAGSRGGWAGLRASAPQWRRLWPAVPAALLAWGLLQTSFGGHPAGGRDAFASFATMGFRAAGGESGHEKPWWYYGSLLVFRRDGYVWDQTLFLLLGAAGAGWALRDRAGRPRFVALYGLIVAGILSLAPYKTPWNLVNLLPPLAFLAALALARCRAAGVPLALAVVLLLGWQTRQAVFARPADPRNPHAYAHAGPDVRKVPALAAAAPAGPVKVISEEYWPLPWYLRGRPEVGYWTRPPDDCDGALVLASAGQAGAVRARLRGRYRESFLGLRPGFLLVVFVPAPEAQPASMPADSGT